MMSFLGENQGNGKRDVAEVIRNPTCPIFGFWKTTGSHLPDEDVDLFPGFPMGFRFKV